MREGFIRSWKYNRPVHAYVVKFYCEGRVEFKCEPPLFARVEVSLRVFNMELVKVSLHG